MRLITQSKAITRQAFGTLPRCIWGVWPTPTQAGNYQDIWWRAPAGFESGCGINFSHQVALAYACKKAGKHATLFCAKRNTPHPRTMEALDQGAKVVEVPYGYLSNVRAKADEYCRLTGAKKLPFGLAAHCIIDGIADVARRILLHPTEVWTVAGSGTLSLALQLAWPMAAFNAVIIGQRHDRIGRAKIWTAPEKYERSARNPPPFPSCDNYDAKAWQFIAKHATPGALFWNVAS